MKNKFLLAVIMILTLAQCQSNNNETSIKDNELYTDNTSMNGFKSVAADELQGNMIKRIGSEWMLITAGDTAKFNTMTASWGGVGELWGKHVVFVFIRPQRYTLGFVNENDNFTLTFFGEGNERQALQICGTKSGRDCDKVEEAGLTPITTSNGSVSFAQAQTIIECKKLYVQQITEESFIDKSLVEKWYKDKDFHYVFVGEITDVKVK